MYKTVTLRLSSEEYKKISHMAAFEHRPISNFITTAVLREIEEDFYADSIEAAQISSDKRLLGKLRAGHIDAVKMRGKFVG